MGLVVFPPLLKVKVKQLVRERRAVTDMTDQVEIAVERKCEITVDVDAPRYSNNENETHH